MKPDFQVIADQRDITALLRDRLLSIRTTDKAGLESDECEIHIDDRDGKVVFPRKGVTLQISLGYVGEGLTLLGKYRVDEIEVSGPPQTIVVRGKPVNIIATMKTQRRHSWEGVTLSAIVSDIARRNKLQPLCSVTASVPRADQINEADRHFITRLAKQYGATATIKDGKLIVAPMGEGKSGGGQTLPGITLRRDDLASYSIKFPNLALFGETAAGYHDNKTGQLKTIVLPNKNVTGEAPKYVERHIHANEAAATAAAKSRMENLNRATATGKLELMRGRADVGAEKWVALRGIKSDIDGTYLIESVEQNYSKSAWITSIEINAGNGGKGDLGNKKASGGAIIDLGAVKK